MRYNIITPEQVVAMAFSDGEYVASEAISEADIDTAIARWVKPIVGEALLEAVAGGSYEKLCVELLQPAVACAVRLFVQPRLNASTSQMGLTVAVGSHQKAADESLRESHLRALRMRARTALYSLSEYLQAHGAEFKEYNPKENVLNRCSCNGGFVQIF